MDVGRKGSWTCNEWNIEEERCASTASELSPTIEQKTPVRIQVTTQFMKDLQSARWGRVCQEGLNSSLIIFFFLG